MANLRFAFFCPLYTTGMYPVSFDVINQESIAAPSIFPHHLNVLVRGLDFRNQLLQMQ